MHVDTHKPVPLNTLLGGARDPSQYIVVVTTGLLK